MDISKTTLVQNLLGKGELPAIETKITMDNDTLMKLAITLILVIGLSIVFFKLSKSE